MRTPILAIVAIGAALLGFSIWWNVAQPYRPAPLPIPEPEPIEIIEPQPEVKPEPKPHNPGWDKFNVWFAEHQKTCPQCSRMKDDPNQGFCMDAFQKLQEFLKPTPPVAPEEPIGPPTTQEQTKPAEQDAPAAEQPKAATTPRTHQAPRRWRILPWRR